MERKKQRIRETANRNFNKSINKINKINRKIEKIDEKSI